MSYVDWTLEGVQVSNCNCDHGCPCQFNGLPTHGDCRAHSWVRVDRGRFGSVSLDDTCFGILATWPGPIHKGSGTMQVFVDDRATPDQQHALELIAKGEETEPGTLVWQIFSTTISEFLPTAIRRINLLVDVDAAVAAVRIPTVIDADIEPIRNPVTHQPHRARVTLPHGFEYTEAEFATGRAKSTGPIALDFAGTHAHLARVHWSTHGVVRSSS
jgi:hypothetical protein